MEASTRIWLCLTFCLVLCPSSESVPFRRQVHNSDLTEATPNCQNGGRLNGDSCTCQYPWAGTTCESCLMTKCENGGTLDATNGKCECLCLPGWGGTSCETCTKSCGANGVLNNSLCTCTCNSPFVGENCETCSLTCRHAGVLNESGCTCTCQQPWAGEDCTTCNLECSNGGILNRDLCVCECLNNWSGDRCDECAKQCHNNGVMNAAICECICPDQWKGNLCEQCTVASCDNGGTYSQSECKCECLNLWKGLKCDDCSGVICGNGGTVNVRDCSCFCRGGWKGIYCDTCDLICNHGVLNKPMCECTCTEGWAGDTCSTCKELHCMNGGLEDLQNCKCICPEPYTGSTCEALHTVPIAQKNQGYTVSDNGQTLTVTSGMDTLGETYIEGQLTFQGVVGSDAETGSTGSSQPLTIEANLDITKSLKAGVVESDGDCIIKGSLVAKSLSKKSKDEPRIKIGNDLKCSGVISSPTLAPNVGPGEKNGGGLLHFAGAVNAFGTTLTTKMIISGNQLEIEGSLAVTGRLDSPVIAPFQYDQPLQVDGDLATGSVYVDYITTLGATKTELDGILGVSGAVETDNIYSLHETYVDANGLIIKPYNPPDPEQVAVHLRGAPDNFGSEKEGNDEEIVESVEDEANRISLLQTAEGPAAEDGVQENNDDPNHWCEGDVLYTDTSLQFEESLMLITLEQELTDISKKSELGKPKYCSLFKGHHLCPSSLDFRFVSSAGGSFSFTIFVNERKDGTFEYNIDETRFVRKVRHNEYQVAGMGDASIYRMKFNDALCRIQLHSSKASSGKVYVQRWQMVHLEQSHKLERVGPSNPANSG